jgi:hypothetical protein
MGGPLLFMDHSDYLTVDFNRMVAMIESFTFRTLELPSCLSKSTISASAPTWLEIGFEVLD